MSTIIDQYIKANSEAKIRTRANGISILDVQQLSVSPPIMSFRIKGSGGIYTVSIKNYDSNKISSSCSCPYDWGGLCKHEVAALRTFKKKAITSAPKKKIKNRTKNGVFSIELEDDLIFSNKLLNECLSNKINQSYSSIKINTSLLEYNHILAEVEAKVQKQYYFSTTETHSQTIKTKDKNLKLTCSCNNYSTHFCAHLYILVKELLATFGETIFQSENTILSKRLEKIEQIGLNIDKDKINYYYDFNIVDNKFKAIGKVKGLGENSSPNSWKNIINKTFNDDSIVETRFNTIDAKKLKQNKIEYLGFALGINWDNNTDFGIQLLKGKLNKAQELSSKITEAETLLELSNLKGITEKDAEEIFTKTRNLSDVQIEELSDNWNIWRIGKEEARLKLINYYIPEIRKVIGLLDKYPTYLIKGHLIKKNLEPVKIIDNSSILSFKFIEIDEFYSLVAYITIDGKKSKLTTKAKQITPLFVQLQNKFYLHHSAEYSAQLNYFKQNPVINIFKENFEQFYTDFIIPLQKKYAVEIKLPKLFEKKKQEKNVTVNKKVFITELNNFVIFKPVVEYPQGEVELIGEEPIQVTTDGKIIEYKRDEEQEQAFLDQFIELHPNFKTQINRQFFYLDYVDMMKNAWFFDAFEEMKKNEIEVFGLNNLKSFNYNPNRPTVTSKVSSGVDWFEVDLVVAFGNNTVSIKDLKKAIIKKEDYIKLDDGSLGIIPEEWIKKYERLFRTGKIKGEKLEIPKILFSVVDELFENIEGSEDVLAEISEKKKKLLSFQKIKNIKQPKGIKAELRDYQLSGISWLNFLEEFSWGGCLADDMGLGKTIQIISFLEHIKNGKRNKKHKTSLIVLPTSLIFNWQDELNKFCPTLKYKVVYGSKRDKSIDDFDEYDLIITTYGVLANDIQSLKNHTFNYAILDESQAIKNPTSRRYKSVRLIKAKNRIVLTGTPIENNTFDLYAQMTFLNPGFFGSSADFKKNYSEPIDKYKDAERAKELQHLISPFLLRRTKEQVAKELPPKTESVLYCEMEAGQRKVYDAYRNKYRDYLLGKIEDDGLGKSKMYVLEGLTKLRQICDSPALLSDESLKTNESIKIKELMNSVTEKTGKHKILIFSQFVKMLEQIKTELDNNNVQYEYLTGKTKTTNRQKKVENFQNNDDVRVFLISLKAGGTGLNLTAADYVYIVDPWWNPAVEAQAIDRCYRIGQNKSVMAYKMICKNTIEEKIIEYQQSKKKLASDIVKTDDSFVKSLTKNDIKDLFS